jgi:hypothetical protein
MASVNKVILVGNLGRDPEVRYLPNGDPVANVTIATSSKYKDKSGNAADEIDRLTAQVEPYKADAERYRWLRDTSTDVALVLDKRIKWVPENENVPGVGGYWIYEYRAGEELDAAIDAAMKGQPCQTEQN